MTRAYKTTASRKRTNIGKRTRRKEDLPAKSGKIYALGQCVTSVDVRHYACAIAARPDVEAIAKLHTMLSVCFEFAAPKNSNSAI